MRIRKRFLLPSLSSSLNLSDPLLNRSQQGNASSPPSNLLPQRQPSDDERFRWFSPELMPKEEEIKSNDTSILGGTTEKGIGFLSTTVVPLKKRKAIEKDTKTNPKASNKKYFKKHGDIKVVPLKKRKAIEKDTKTNPKASNKKYFKKHGQDEIQEDGENNYSTKLNIDNNDKKMNYKEVGTRCSRANGRGWRCYQKALVGYSLCEHHLSKRRIRSLKKGNANKRIDEVTNLSNNYFPNSSQFEKRYIEEKDDDEKKLGMVMKARSLSILLGQTNGVVLVDNDEKINIGSV